MKFFGIFEAKFIKNRPSLTPSCVNDSTYYHFNRFFAHQEFFQQGFGPLCTTLSLLGFEEEANNIVFILVRIKDTVTRKNPILRLDKGKKSEMISNFLLRFEIFQMEVVVIPYNATKVQKICIVWIVIS